MNVAGIARVGYITNGIYSSIYIYSIQLLEVLLLPNVIPLSVHKIMNKNGRQIQPCLIPHPTSIQLDREWLILVAKLRRILVQQK